ncbi:hypothetical protein P3T20_005771 [Paraburkholderia sp. GAS206C]|uniref:hypothetical protein n=1 Tax=unclassified Paraburkholderia TaxID=2615204 RepID=UPI003D20E6EC
MTSRILLGWRRTVVTVLSLVGAFTVLSQASRHLVAHDAYPLLEKLEGLQSFPSPDGQYRVDLLSWAGGGGLAPCCNQVLLVIPASLDIDQAQRDKRYEVYSAECDSFADHSASPKIARRSNQVLDVSFSINSTAAFARNVTLKKVDASGKFKLEFSAKE